MYRVAYSAYRKLLVSGLLVLMLLLMSKPATAQQQLIFANDSTTVREISFRFPESRSFESDQLKAQLATTEPSWWDRLKRRRWLRWLPLSQKTHPFNPIDLQKDVVRLRNFYKRNGFLEPRIDYPASGVDTTRNTIRIIFTIREGPPLRIEAIDFVTPDGTRLADTFTGRLRTTWEAQTARLRRQVGERLTDFVQLQIQDQAITWLKDRGFVFVEINTRTHIDTNRNTATLLFEIDPGPQAYVSDILIEGNNSVRDEVVERELPFERGDRFSSRKLTAGQQELFGLNIFRVALADVPPQPVDSTVDVRIRLTEGNLRYVSSLIGYDREGGVRYQGSWNHRNFLGDARSLTLGLTAITGWTPGFLRPPDGGLTQRRFRFETPIRQPYVFITNLSATFTPFTQFEYDPNLEASDRLFEVNRGTVGFESLLYYEILPFRTASTQYQFTRSFLYTDPRADTLSNDVFNTSIFSLTGTVGDVNNFLNPRRGVLSRPTVEIAGGVLNAGVEFFKLSHDLSIYVPVARGTTLTTRLFMGHMWLFGRSQDALAGRLTSTDSLTYENRFDAYRFYAGGTNDVRGWSGQLIGDKIARATPITDSTGTVLLDSEGRPRLTDVRYEAIGGDTKLRGSIELRFPLPRLANTWRGVTFLDFGHVTEDRINLGRIRYGTGFGIRYRTPVGLFGFDVAYKLNPSRLDLRRPDDVYRFENAETLGWANPEPPEERFGRRFGFHLSIGQSF